MTTVYPPIRRKILAQILKIVGLFGLLGFSLIIGIYATSSDPKTVLVNLNKNTSEVLVMSETWDLIHTPLIVQGSVLEYSQRDLNIETLVKRFDRALNWFENRNLKNDEAVTYKQIRSLWQQIHEKNFQVNTENFLRMRTLLKRFIDELQYNIEQGLENSSSFARRTVFLECVIFLIGLSISVYFSERFSSNIAQPLKVMTEVLKHKPNLNQKLKFPEPSSLEIKFLMNELTDLWKRLSDVQAQNLKDLANQRNQTEAIFAAMEDAVLVLNDENCISHYNEGFLEVIQVANTVNLLGQVWGDLSIMSQNYLALRNLVRHENFEESLFVCLIATEKYIYRVRKRNVTENDNDTIVGYIFLLHNITSKLPKEKRLELNITPS